MGCMSFGSGLLCKVNPIFITMQKLNDKKTKYWDSCLSVDYGVAVLLSLANSSVVCFRMSALPSLIS